MESGTFNVISLRRVIEHSLNESCGLPQRHARIVARHLLAAEQMGKSDHGVVRLKSLIASGKSTRSVDPEICRVSPGHLSGDGSGCLGYVVLHQLVSAATREAQRTGVCVATAANTYPTGALCHWATIPVRAGIGIILMANSPARVAGIGGRTGVIGTNPICLGIPTSPPLIADFSTAAMTHGAWLQALATDDRLPLGGAIRADGQPACRASEIDLDHSKGAICASRFGGDAHKAFALGLAIEAFSRMASYGGYGPYGAFACLFDLARPGIDAATRWLRELDADGIRIPGWSSYARLERQRRGCTVLVSPAGMAVLERLIPANDLAIARMS